ncbi:MAG: secretin and TonB N-terminal domain-containing protein [Candidatus Omnitrophica bacterium]|nr:secretin and TonB N-terminal domain-containing protein [Candidatus Omnitrophota bacterium]
MRLKKPLLLVMVVIGMACNINTYAYSQDIVEEEPVAQVEEAGTVAPAEEASTPGHVTLIFKDADIRTVLHTLSYKSGVNIVASSGVEGKVSIRLVDVPWETALEVILKNQGLASERLGNIIRVITLESVAEEELQNEVFVLNYSNAKEVSEAIEDTVTERGKVKYDERTNTVIVTDIPTNLHKIRQVIERLDKRTPQITIEAKIIETTLDKDENLGINWTIQASASGSARPTTLPFEAVGSPFARSRGDGSELQRFGHYLPTGSPDADPPFPISDLPAFPTVEATSFTFGTLDFSQFSAALEILKSRTDTKIISQPTITTLNNYEANVSVSTVFNIPTYERNETTGRMEVTGYTEKDIGIILTVVPHVNDAGDIVVDLRPEVSSFIQFDTFGVGDNAIQAPRFSTRTAETQVMLKNNQTIAIGGLMKETATKFKKKVPVLGDIPILGELFKKTEDGIETVDLLIFVTVRLVDETQDDKLLMKETEKKAIHAGEEENIF